MIQSGVKVLALSYVKVELLNFKGIIGRNDVTRSNARITYNGAAIIREKKVTN